MSRTNVVRLSLVNRLPVNKSGTWRLSRTLTAGFTLLLMALSCSAMKADEFSQESHYAVRLFSVGSLTVDTRVGDIDITGWDEPRVQIDAEKVVRAKNQA